MGILDDAIREHLDLKRTHGADDSELRKIEAEAFGPPVRPGDSEPGSESSETDLPDAEAEAPTEFLGASVPPVLEAPPEDEEPAPQDEEFGETGEFGEGDPPEPPAESAPPPPSAPSTEEREVIAEQPTQFFDFESEVSAVEESPSADDLYEERLSEPRLAPAEPVAGDLTGDALTQEPAADEPFDEDPEPSGPVDQGIGPEPIEEGEITIEQPPETDEQFFDESSLSDELDRALDAPEAEEPLPEPEPEAQAPPAPVEPEREAPPAFETEPVAEDDPAPQSPELSDDVLEETPEFLQDTPEDERLWFEQKPPKDFDFDE